MSEKDVIRVSCGALHTLCVTSEGNLWVFGHNKYGKLGLGMDQNQSQPQQVALKGKQGHSFV